MNARKRPKEPTSLDSRNKSEVEMKRALVVDDKEGIRMLEGAKPAEA